MVKGLGLEPVCVQAFLPSSQDADRNNFSKDIFYYLFACICVSIRVAFHVYAGSHRSQKRIPGAIVTGKLYDVAGGNWTGVL